jgi:hypothetical protein
VDQLPVRFLKGPAPGSSEHGSARSGGGGHLAELIALYVRSEPAVERDRIELGPINGFPEQHT